MSTLSNERPKGNNKAAKQTPPAQFDNYSEALLVIAARIQSLEERLNDFESSVREDLSLNSEIISGDFNFLNDRINAIHELLGNGIPKGNEKETAHAKARRAPKKLQARNQRQNFRLLPPPTDESEVAQ